MFKNILICYYSIGGTSYYYDFAEEFLKSDNNILHWNLYYATYNAKNKNKILEKISGFKPDLIFSYNNICPEDIVREMKVPVLILDADNPEFFQNKEIINKYDYLYYLGYQSNSGELYKKILNVDVNKQNYLFFPTATNFHNDPLKVCDTNISFIGSNFYRNFLGDRIVTPQERDMMIYLAKKIRENYYFIDPNIDVMLINFTKYYLAGQDRLKYLSCISDLGLQIYSNSNWKELFTYDLELANCYNEKVIITKNENQDVYNSSKISINLSHLQATNSFSWRVPDIMATNSCLIMEDKVDWRMIFGEYISDVVKKAIIYKDRYDLREKCIKLLKDEDLRQRCVIECQNAIEKNGRWKSRIESLETFLNLKLLGNSSSEPGMITEEISTAADGADEEAISISTPIPDKETEGTSSQQEENFNNREIFSETKTAPSEDRIFLEFPKKKVKSDLAIFLRCIVITVYFIPIIGKKLIKKRRINKIIYKISDKLNHEN